MVSNNTIDSMIERAMFDSNSEARQTYQQKIRDLASANGISLGSMQGLYEAAGKGLYRNKTVPALNIRGLTYHTARAVFRMALKYKVGAFVFEIARTEMVYTDQTPAEYAVSILAAAIKEGFRGPVFILGDHFQANQGKFTQDPVAEVKVLEDAARAAITAGFLNKDIDSSTLVDLSKPTVDEQQKNNYVVAADMTKFIRSIQPEGVTISVGGEVGEVGKSNTTVEELRAYMNGYKKRLGAGIKGITKMAVQTGTTHGGVVLPNGTVADVNLDFKTIEELGKVAREEYGVGGIVQHGASTLPEEMFELFPKAGTLEVHLATEFQNIIYDNPHFPKELLNKMYGYIKEKYPGDRAAGDTEEQFLYKTRKKAFGGFKRETWHLPEKTLAELMNPLENKFALLFQRLNVTNTVELVNRYCSKPR
ncbi:MAG TPA: class II fructose-bisphosphate aldolase [Dehalococcoidia bacterium]